MLQNTLLTTMKYQQALVNIYLTNGIRLKGYVTGIDNFAIFFTAKLIAPNSSQMIYKHAISTISEEQAQQLLG